MTRKVEKFDCIVLLVIDGLGIGEMQDTKLVRPADIGANTALNVIENCDLEFTTLKKLGLHYLCGSSTTLEGCVSMSNLLHFGADSFLGHQEIMATNPIKPEFAPFSSYLAKVEELLEKLEINFRRHENTSLLVIEECFTIGDNIETDLGQAFNITADLNVLSFDEVVKIAKEIRKVIKVPRLIVFGSKDTSLARILDSVEIKEDPYVGVNAPKSGVYTDTYQCVHLGYGVDITKQASYNLLKSDVLVTLIGKTADVITAPGATYLPCVDTTEVMQTLIKTIKADTKGLVFVNVQETDLAGHSQDVKKFGQKLKIVDDKLAEVISILGETDLLIVMADHGDDPMIGHAQHTREFVPIMMYNQHLATGQIKNRLTMADVGQTLYDALTGQKLEFGQSFLAEIKAKMK